MRNYREHLIIKGKTVKDALAQLNVLAADAILFVINQDEKLIGSLTDGDIRRGFLNGLTLEALVEEFIQPNPRFIIKGSYSIKDIISFRTSGFKIIPVLDNQHIVRNIINFRYFKSYLPLDAMIMAGGRGERLRPLTDTLPKPLLNVGDKPIIEHNIDRLAAFGIDDVWVSLRYMGDKIENYLGSGSNKGIKIDYVWEQDALGTAGALSMAEGMHNETLLLMNSDLLTNIDYEDFYIDFMQKGADLAVACVPYQVSVPYGIMEVVDNKVKGFREKPTYTYYSNAGIYLMKREVKEMITPNQFTNATDLIEKIIKQGGNVVTYPLVGYWLDIGKHEDYQKAQEEIKHIRF